MRSVITIGWIIAFLTTLLMGTFFYYHFQKKKTELKAHGIIELDYMERNIREKYAEYQKILDNIKQINEKEGSLESPPDTLHPIYSEMKIEQSQLFLPEKKSKKGVQYILKVDSREVNFSKFLAPIIRKDFFDEIMVIKTSFNQIQYASDNNLNLTPNFSALLKIKSDSSLGTQVSEVKISGVPHLAFISHIKIGQMDCQILCFKKKDSFLAEARQISPYLLNNAFLLLLLILCAIPVIRIFGMGKGDSLSKTHILQTGFGVLTLSFFLAFSLGYVFNSENIASHHESQLNQKSEYFLQKSNNFLKKITRKLDLLTPLSNPCIKSYLKRNKNSYNEFIKSHKDDTSASFFITPKGVLAKKKKKPIIMKIDDRDYFQVFNDGSKLQNHLSYSSSNKKKQTRFFISSHFSNASGKIEGVVSKLIADSVHVLTFPFSKLDSLSNLSDSMVYRQMIVRTDGKIIYHSEKDKRWSNLFSEIENSNEKEKIKAFINSQEPVLKTSFRFENVKCNAILRPLDLKSTVNKKTRNAFFLVTYQDENVPYIQSSLAMTGTLIFIIGAILLISLIALFTFLGRFQSERTQLSIFSYHWTRPSPLHVTGHLQNIVLCGVQLISILILVYHNANNILVYALAFAQSITCISLFRYLNITLTPTFQFIIPRKEVNWFFIYGTAILFLGFTICLATLIPDKNWILFYLVFQLAGVFLTFYSKSALKKFGSASFSKSSQIFIISTHAWLFTIAFVPTVIVQNTLTEIEQYLWANQNVTKKQEEKKEQQGVPHESGDSFLSHIRITPQQTEIFGEPVSNYYYSSQSNNLKAQQQTSSFLNNSFHFVWKSLLFFTVIYFLFKNISNRLFLTQLIMGLKARVKHQPFLTTRTFCIGLPHSGKTKFIKNLLPSKAKLKSFDFIDLGEVKEFTDSLNSLQSNETYTGIQIRNMDNLIYDFDSFHSFLDAVGSYNKNSGIKLIIYSHSTIYELIERINSSSATKANKDKLINKITFLFTSFVTLIVPLKPRPLNWITSPIMANEFKYGPNIQKLHAFGRKTTTKLPMTQIEEENIIMKIKEYNYTYYLTLWNTLTIREKHTIYDLAQNGFLNHANLDKIELLCKKGVLRINNKKQQIELFNQSFGIFVNSILNEKEVQEFKNIQKTEGNWAAIRLIILFIVGAIILFLFITDPNMVNKSLGIISIVSTAFFALNRMYQGVTSFKFLKSNVAEPIEP